MKILSNVAIVSTLLLLAAGLPALGQDTGEIEAYPIDFCIVSGQKLGSMGPAVDYMHEGRLVRFCCRGCIATFKSNPEKYLAVLDGHQVPVKTEGSANPAPATAGCCANPVLARAGCCANPNLAKTGCGAKQAPVPARGCRPGCRP